MARPSTLAGSSRSEQQRKRLPDVVTARTGRTGAKRGERCWLAFCLLGLIQDPQPPRFADVPGQDARHYAIELRVDLARRELSGTVDYLFVATEPLQQLRLDARRSEDWHVTFTTPAGEPLQVTWNDETQGVVLDLPERIDAGGQIAFRAKLHGTPVDGFYFKDNRYGEPMAFTDHYSVRARGWLPCEDNPKDRATFSLRLFYPEGDDAVAFGVAGESPLAPPAGYRALATRSEFEIPPYMWALVVGPFARVEEAGDPRLRPHLVYRQDVDEARPLLVHDAEWLQTMERTFGPYPFGKYTTVQCPTRWGGFEAPGNVQLAEQLFDKDRNGTATLAHELVHMWFGDGVGYAEWREVWLSEGFASYFGPWLLSRTGGPLLRDSMARLRTAWARSRDGRIKSVRDDRFAHPDQALNANTYPKGAWVLHMLRQELGDEAFFTALRHYFESCRGRSVTTADFVAAVEQNSEQELSWFFEQWLDRIGCPELRVEPTDGGIRVTQVQRGEPYRFWLRLRWTGADGEQVERRVRIESAEQNVEVDGPVDALEVDPEVELLFRPGR